MRHGTAALVHTPHWKYSCWIRLKNGLLIPPFWLAPRKRHWDILYCIWFGYCHKWRYAAQVAKLYRMSRVARTNRTLLFRRASETVWKRTNRVRGRSSCTSRDIPFIVMGRRLDFRDPEWVNELLTPFYGTAKRDQRHPIFWGRIVALFQNFKTFD